MATLAIQELLRNSALPELTLSNAAASDTFPNDGEVCLLVVTTSAVATTLTIEPAGDGRLPVGDASLVDGYFPITNDLGNDQPSLGIIGKLEVGAFGAAPVITPGSPTGVKYAAVKVF